MNEEMLQYLKEGFVVGYVVSAAFVAAIFMSYYYLLWFSCRRRRMAKLMLIKKNTQSTKPLAAVISNQFQDDEYTCNKLIDQWQIPESVGQMSFEETRKATDDFSNHNIIGSEKCCCYTYKAMLKDDNNHCLLLAVTRLNPSQQLHNRFISELKSVGRLRHINLVPLLGFCFIPRREQILVYKYISNGNLCDWLHPPLLHETTTPLEMEWALRLKIAVGVARGLAWLHHQTDLRLAHLNISSTTILLDENFEPKISNFGGAMFLHLNNDSGDPHSSSRNGWELEYAKKDVYDFGVVLLELITLKKRSQMSSYDSSALVEWVSHLMTSSSNSVDGKDFNYEILKIAFDCVQTLPDRRPTMLQVHRRIRDLPQPQPRLHT